MSGKDRGREKDRDDQNIKQAYTVITWGGNRPNTSERSRHSNYGSGPSGKDLSDFHNQLNEIASNREEEIHQMRDNNDALGNYMEKARFYEYQNRRLKRQLDELKENLGREPARIRKMYETELDTIQKLTEKGKRERDDLDDKLKSRQKDLEEITKKLEDERKSTGEAKEDLNKKTDAVKDKERELVELRADISKIEDGRNDLKRENDILREQVRDLRRDKDREMQNYLTALTTAHALKEELDFFKTEIEQRRKELEKLAKRDPNAEMREAWKSELSGPLRELHEKFINDLQQLRSELESTYNMRVSEIRMNQTKGSTQMTVYLKEIERLTASKSELEARLATLEPRIEYLKNELKRLNDQKDELEKANKDKLKKLEEEEKNADEKIKELKKQFEKISQERASLMMEIAQYKMLLDQLTTGSNPTKEQDDMRKKMMGKK